MHELRAGTTPFDSIRKLPPAPTCALVQFPPPATNESGAGVVTAMPRDTRLSMKLTPVSASALGLVIVMVRIVRPVPCATESLEYDLDDCAAPITNSSTFDTEDSVKIGPGPIVTDIELKVRAATVPRTGIVYVHVAKAATELLVSVTLFDVFVMDGQEDGTTDPLLNTWRPFGRTSENDINCADDSGFEIVMIMLTVPPRTTLGAEYALVKPGASVNVRFAMFEITNGAFKLDTLKEDNELPVPYALN